MNRIGKFIVYFIIPMVFTGIILYLGVFMLFTNSFSNIGAMIAFLLFVIVAKIFTHEHKNKAKERNN